MSNVIQFSTSRLSAKRTAEIEVSAGAIIASVHQIPTEPILSRRGRPLPEPRTESCRNQRLRLKRRNAWRAAHRLTAYWRARLDWQRALSTAQDHDVGDAKSFPPCDDSGSSRIVLVDLWRAALVAQMLTPAFDVAGVNWKRSQLRAVQYRYCAEKVKSERLQHAIEADIEWLEAHPTRKSVAASRQGKKSD